MATCTRGARKKVLGPVVFDRDWDAALTAAHVMWKNRNPGEKFSLTIEIEPPKQDDGRSSIPPD